jgi:hypothetical protein
MPYQPVFDISQKGFDWWFPGLGLGLTILGVIQIWIGHRKHWTGAKRWFGYVYVAFGAFWTLSVFSSTHSEYDRLHQAYRDGHYATVEGRVEDFRPMPYEGHQDECFSVQTVRFCYSNYEVTPGFNNATSHGGPVRAGLPVRVSYIGGNIIRLEIRRDAVPTADETARTEKAAESKMVEQQDRDPVLDQMNLGFLLAAVFMTGWWNLSWRRFMRFWLKPPYRRVTVVGFRVFFALNLASAVGYLISSISRKSRLPAVYIGAAEIGAAWIAVIFLGVNLVEWLARRSERRENLQS